ncbi:MAG: NAD(+)/NADH kinase [Thermoleophilia bacterium]
MLELCRELSVEAVIPQSEVDKYAGADVANLATVVTELDSVEVDIAVALGGDGTILRAFSRFNGMQTPIIGFNFGRVGFLSAMGPDDIPAGLKSVLEGNYELIGLSLLELVNQEETHLAINDIVVHKPEGGSVIHLAYAINGVEYDSFRCDGFVASTPAGSTAYNLSNGGPLVTLALDAYILTSIAPHVLRSRAMVLGPTDTLTIRNDSKGSMGTIYVDGRPSGSLAPGDDVMISLAARRAQLVQPPGADFYRTLRDKFIKPSS